MLTEQIMAIGTVKFFNINKGAEHVNLEVLSPVTSLAPGESRTTKAAFSVVQERPAGR